MQRLEETVHVVDVDFVEYVVMMVAALLKNLVARRKWRGTVAAVAAAGIAVAVALGDLEALT
jgi:hypothetical protein